METATLLIVGWLVGWCCRSALFWWERDCADRTHGNDGYLNGLKDAADAVQGMISCDHCEGCEALDYAVVEIAALISQQPRAGELDGGRHGRI